MRYLKLFKIFIISIVALFIMICGLNIYISLYTKAFIKYSPQNLSAKYTCIVLGAHVSGNGTPSSVLEDRLNAAIFLYKSGKIKRFLLSGDHGRVNYDEVNSMKNFLIDNGIPQSEIFLDHAGFDTYNTMTRALKVFQVKDAIIVTQEFHLKRAVYIARKTGINADGYIACLSDKRPLKYLQIREYLACIKAFFEVFFNKKPHFLGPEIPITGDSRLSYDEI